MGTTAKGFRYPEVTDQVAQGATAIRNLATDVDTYLSTARARAHVYLNAAYTFTSNGFVYAAPLTAASGLLTGMTISTTTRLTIPTTGVYRIAAAARVGMASGTAPAAASNSLLAAVYRNGTTTLTSAFNAPGLNVSMTPATRLVSLTAGDYLELRVTGLANAVLQNGEDQTFLYAELV